MFVLENYMLITRKSSFSFFKVEVYGHNFKNMNIDD